MAEYARVAVAPELHEQDELAVLRALLQASDYAVLFSNAERRDIVGGEPEGGSRYADGRDYRSTLRTDGRRDAVQSDLELFERVSEPVPPNGVKLRVKDRGIHDCVLGKALQGSGQDLTLSPFRQIGQQDLAVGSAV